jgi:hypothetical protein
MQSSQTEAMIEFTHTGVEIKPITFYHGSWRQEKIYSPYPSYLSIMAWCPCNWEITFYQGGPPGMMQVVRMGGGEFYDLRGSNIEAGSFRYTNHACNFFLHIDN